MQSSFPNTAPPLTPPPGPRPIPLLIFKSQICFSWLYMRWYWGVDCTVRPSQGVTVINLYTLELASIEQACSATRGLPFVTE